MKRKLMACLGTVALLLSACADTGLSVAEGGMTGTGISTGRITGFGSIYVNGIHYDIDTASLYRDGQLVTDANEFGTGELVTVTGTLNTDNNVGSATKVEFNSLVIGEVSAIDGTTLTVLGQTIDTDLLTVFHGFDQLNALLPGNVIEVSGFRAADQRLYATSITRLTDSYTAGESLKLQGTISNLQPTQQTFQLGKLIIDYSAAHFEATAQAALANQQRVQVTATTQPQGLTVKADRISATTKLSYTVDERIEVEGLVSALHSTDQFTVDEQLIQVSDTTVFKGLSITELKTGLALEVAGQIDNAGVLQAQVIELRDVRASNIQDIAGQISATNPQEQTITVAGYTLYRDNSSMFLQRSDAEPSTRAQKAARRPHIQFSDLKVGDYVDVTALQLADGRWQVLRLDLGGRL